MMHLTQHGLVAQVSLIAPLEEEVEVEEEEEAEEEAEEEVEGHLQPQEEEIQTNEAMAQS